MKKRAAKHGCLGAGGLAGIDERSEGGTSSVVPLVAARWGQTAVKQQSAIGGIEECLSGGSRAETTGILAANVSGDGAARDFFSRVIEVRLLPAFRRVRGTDKYNVKREALGTLGG